MSKKNNTLILYDYYINCLYLDLKAAWFFQRKHKKKLRLEIDRMLKKREFKVHQLERYEQNSKKD